MTIKSDKNESVSDGEAQESKSTDTKESTNTDKVKKNKVVEKISRKFSPLLITILVSIPAVGFIVYMNMPDQINQLLDVASESLTTATVATEEPPATAVAQSQTPVDSVSRLNQSPASGLNPYQQPEWVAKQRAETEQRRLEFQKRNPEPEWVKKQRAEMEKYQAGYQRQNTDNYAANGRQAWVPPEPPQWLKDRQVKIEQEMTRRQQEMEKYQQEMAKQQREWASQVENRPYNVAPQRPNYMRHPRMNPYQQNQNVANNQMQPQQNPANVYHPQQRNNYNSYNYRAMPRYYNNPYFYGYGPNIPPNGWNGYRY